MKRNIIIYIIMTITIIALLLIFPDMSDSLQMILFASIIIMTSIFTYGNRRKK